MMMMVVAVTLSTWLLSLLSSLCAHLLLIFQILNLTEHDDEEDEDDDDDVDDEKEGEEKEEKEDYGAFNLCVGDDGAHPLIDTQSAFSTFKLGLWQSSWVIKMITL